MSMMIFITAIGLSVADIPAEKKIVPSETKAAENTEEITANTELSLKDAAETVISQDQASNIMVDAANDLSTGEIESALSKMTESVRITTADGKTYNGKKSVRKALNTAFAGSLKSIRCKPVVDEYRPFEKGAMIFGHSKETFSDSIKKPYTLDSQWSATLVWSDGKAQIDSIHHSINIHKNAIINEERETFTYVAAAVAGGAAILGFVLGWGL